jgi:hypothetical protein
VVAVVVVDNHDVFVSVARGDGESARLPTLIFLQETSTACWKTQFVLERSDDLLGLLKAGGMGTWMEVGASRFGAEVE